MKTNEHELKTILANGETLTVEFKSDARGLPDRDLVAAKVYDNNKRLDFSLQGQEYVFEKVL